MCLVSLRNRTPDIGRQSLTTLDEYIFIYLELVAGPAAQFRAERYGGSGRGKFGRRLSESTVV